MWVWYLVWDFRSGCDYGLAVDLGFGALGWFGGCSGAGDYGGVYKFWFGHGFGVCSDQVLGIRPQKVEKFEWCVPNRLRQGVGIF